MNKDDKLYQMLLEDTESDAEATELLVTMQRLEVWQAPTPTSQATASLIERLTDELRTAQLSRLERWLAWWPLLLIRSQARVVQREIWTASALILALGTVVTLATYTSGAVIPLGLIAPVVAAVGVALLYDSDTEQVAELENATPASLRLLLLARLTLVFGFDLVITLTGSLLLSLFQMEISLWPLVLSWLAPMAFLSGLAFLASVVFADVLAGSMLSLGLWGLHVLLRYTTIDNTLFTMLFSFPGLSHPANRSVLFITAAALVALALWLAGREERLSGVNA